MAVPFLRAVALKRHYNRGEAVVRALEDVSLDVREGEFVAVMGASGSGKSTFLHILGLLDSPTAGHYWFAGREVSAANADAKAAIRNREIGFVFQNFQLLNQNSALQNVELPLVYAGLRRTERIPIAREKLARVGLDHRWDHTPNQLSGGEQQRVGIARALVCEPRLILADEPTGALDSRTSAEILALLQTLNAEGRTIIMVTHDANIAKHAGRIVAMRDGCIVSDRGSRSTLSTATPVTNASPN